MIEENPGQSDTSAKSRTGTPATFPLTPGERALLVQRLAAYATDGNRGRLMPDVLADLRQRL